MSTVSLKNINVTIHFWEIAHQIPIFSGVNPYEHKHANFLLTAL